MSIALSVPLVPSRRLRLLVLGFGGACLLMAAALAAGACGPSRWPLATAALCLAAGLALLRTWRGRSTVRALDVLGPARLVLTVQQGDGAVRRVPVRLLAGSTLWPGLLVLRFDGVPALVLLSDSVAHEQFRPLAVALRTIAARAADPAEKYYQNL